MIDLKHQAECMLSTSKLAVDILYSIEIEANPEYPADMLHELMTSPLVQNRIGVDVYVDMIKVNCFSEDYQKSRVKFHLLNLLKTLQPTEATLATDIMSLYEERLPHYPGSILGNHGDFPSKDKIPARVKMMLRKLFGGSYPLYSEPDTIRRIILALFAFQAQLVKVEDLPNDDYIGKPFVLDLLPTVVDASYYVKPIEKFGESCALLVDNPEKFAFSWAKMGGRIFMLDDFSKQRMKALVMDTIIDFIGLTSRLEDEK